MKYLDKVKIISNKYEKDGIFKGDVGHILSAEIRFNTFDFYRENPQTKEDDLCAAVFVGDLELIESSNITDSELLEALSGHNPNWWCKVENGYILNLKGEKKNKIPYDYNS
ncbi:MAG: hypothetical protein IJY57_00325 [Clostridia bacterium]|nr:hypothetical protein [Clostridia bacterium]